MLHRFSLFGGLAALALLLQAHPVHALDHREGPTLELRLKAQLHATLKAVELFDNVQAAVQSQANLDEVTLLTTADISSLHSAAATRVLAIHSTDHAVNSGAGIPAVTIDYGLPSSSEVTALRALWVVPDSDAISSRAYTDERHVQRCWRPVASLSRGRLRLV